jgi:hypothetical protein
MKRQLGASRLIRCGQNLKDDQTFFDKDVIHAVGRLRGGMEVKFDQKQVFLLGQMKWTMNARQVIYFFLFYEALELSTKRWKPRLADWLGVIAHRQHIRQRKRKID